MKKLSNAEIKAVQQMKAGKTNKASVGSLRFMLRNSPYREKEYELFSFDHENPHKTERRAYISWKEFDEVKPA